MQSIKDKLKNKQTNNQNNTENTESTEKTIKELSKKSESELMSELLSVASQKRQDGSLNNQDLDNFKDKIAPSLTKEQSERLDQIIAMLKG